MSKLMLWIGGGLIGLLLAIGVYFMLYNKVDGNPWKMIPDTPALILKTEHPRAIYESLRQENEIWKTLLRTAELTKLQLQINMLDSLLIEEPEYQQLLWNSASFISIYVDSLQQNTQTLFISKLESKVNLVKLRKSLSLKLGTQYAVLDIKNINNAFKIIDGETQHNLFVAFKDGLFVATASLELLQSALGSYKNHKHFSTSPAFIKLQQTAGKNVDAHLFFNYKSLTSLLATAANEKQMKRIPWLKHFGGWGAADIMIKKDELLLTGYSNFSSGSDFLHILRNQESVKTDIINVLPFNTNQLLWVGLSDFIPFFETRNHDDINKRLGIKIAQFTALINDEIAIANNAQTLGSYDEHAWVFIGLNKPEAGIDYLNQLARLSGSSTTEKHKGFTIRRINYKLFLGNLLGDAFSTVSENFYTQIGDYVVFANSVTSLKQLIHYYETGITLDLNENFKNFSDNLSGASNLLLFIKPRDFTDLSEQFVNTPTTRFLQQNESIMHNFQGIALQYSAGPSLAYTSFYIKHNKSYQEENLSIWKTQLDAEIVGKPSLVKDHTNDTYNVLVFDKDANMYLVSTSGQVMWKKRIDALPIGSIHSVDYYKNGKIQYLFNTKDYMYLIDINGNHVAKYPIKLNPSATNGLSVFDYNRSKDYRLLIAQSDKRIYNYSIKGKEIGQWTRPHTRNIVGESISRLVANNKDYIITTDIDNHISIVDRRGNTRIRLTKEPEKSINSGYYVNKTNSKGVLITTNTKGQLMYISATGGIKYTDFGQFSPQHFFLYEDFNGNGSHDFIFVDGTELRVFDRHKKLLFQYDFESDITIKPEFIRLSSKEKVLGIVADKQKSIFLFDSKGNTIISKGLVGETPFTVGSMNSNRDINLITAIGNTLYNYQIK